MDAGGSFFIGVDIGTTSVKAVAYDRAGAVAGHHSIGYPLYAPAPAVAEQDPEEIFSATTRAIAGAVSAAGARPQAVAGVAFSAAMHSVIAVDADGRPLTRSITWTDNRAARWAERLKGEMDGRSIYLRTGVPVHPMSPLAKLLWLRHERPELFARADRFIGVKEYVFFRLFGRHLVDLSIASATGMLNLEALDWDPGALEIAGIGPERLSTPVPTTEVVAGLPKDVADAMGIAADTPFVIGANDGVLSNLGLDAVRPGDVAVTIGTSGAMRAMVGRPQTDPEQRTFCYHLTPDHWVVGGPINNGGIAFRWVRDEFAAAETETAKRLGIDPYDVLTRIAARVPPGSAGLIFHPYLAGERAPWWNPRMRGSFFGLAMHHHKEHMVRAVLEGVIFSLHSILGAVEALIGPTSTIRASGGFARSELWRQMLADVFDREVVVPESFESSCLGAAVLGMVGLGLVPSLDVVSVMVGATRRHCPIPAHVATYDQLKPIFMSLPAKLADEYSAIAAYQEAGGPAQDGRS
ncbi:MAG: gluconokinase [Rhodospirillales bacterium]|jgi:gluconokinase|nr:gluconokinase [Rhodospirillales bacterium]